MSKLFTRNGIFFSGCASGDIYPAREDIEVLSLTLKLFNLSLHENSRSIESGSCV